MTRTLLRMHFSRNLSRHGLVIDSLGEWAEQSCGRRICTKPALRSTKVHFSNSLRCCLYSSGDKAFMQKASEANASWRKELGPTFATSKGSPLAWPAGDKESDYQIVVQTFGLPAQGIREKLPITAAMRSRMGCWRLCRDVLNLHLLQTLADCTTGDLDTVTLYSNGCIESFPNKLPHRVSLTSGQCKLPIHVESSMLACRRWRHSLHKMPTCSADVTGHLSLLSRLVVARGC